MDLERYYELRTILQQWRLRLAESVRDQIEGAAHWLSRLRALYQGEGTDEAFTLWLDRWCRQAAIQFILRVLFLRVLEDRELLGATRLRDTDGQKMWAQLTRNLGAAHYVQWCCWDAAHLLPDLFGPTDYDLVPPDDALAQRFLDDVWRRPDPNRPGYLRFDFRPAPDHGDAGFETRFIGDLYQELDAEIRDRYALLQTPHFISQFILEHTLLQRFEEKDFREVTLIDPTCGSGHFLVDAFWMFIERYDEASGGRPAASAARADVARTVIERHLFGCDINPYATALARFRLILAACDYAQPISLCDFRDLHLNLVTIDSLIPYEKLITSNWQDSSTVVKVLGQPKAIQRARTVLRRRYDIVVGNPPYIFARDPAKRDIYREHYAAAYWKFALSAPFIERFLQLSSPNALIGLIASNSFATRQFGKKLIEEVLPKFDVQSLLDLSGVYIPGHGTPTVLLLIRNQRPSLKDITVVSCMRGEPEGLVDPAQGEVWSSVKAAFYKETGYEDEFVSVDRRPRDRLSIHPWQFGGAESRLFSKLTRDGKSRTVSDDVELIGFGVVTGADEIYITSQDYPRRQGFPEHLYRFIITGEDIRDWGVGGSQICIFPYDSSFNVLDIYEFREVLAHFEPLKRQLSQRRGKGFKTPAELGRKWYEFGMYYPDRYNAEHLITYAEITTHNHFVPTRGGRLYHHSAPIIKLASGEGALKLVLACLLNSSTICFCLKQICFDKRAGKDPVRDKYFDFAGTMVGKVPVPQDYLVDSLDRRRMLALTEEMIALTSKIPTLTMRKLFEQKGEAYHDWNSAPSGYVAPHPDLCSPFTNTRELLSAREKLIALRLEIRYRMIFLQEEMDWQVYETYDLIRKAPLAEDYLSHADYEAARLALGQRPFKLAGKGYTGDWPSGYQPPPLPEPLRALTEARIALIESNADIALLEDPLYKRRWIPPDDEREFRDAARWWLAEKLEWALEQHGAPLALRRWARLLGDDERVNAVLEALTGSPMFDLEAQLLDIIRANTVPNRPEYYLKPSGLRKLYAGQDTPQFQRKDFSDGAAWKLRGKLNIPRERFIAYTAFDHTQRGVDAPDTGGPWFGWAGWDAGQRADALAFLLDRANRAGWALHWQQCGLRAALRDLLPELADLPDADRAEFKAIAAMCGIGLGTRCYCQAYREGVARGEPGVPGVGEEVLGVKVLSSEAKRSRRGQKKTGSDAEQLSLGL